MRHAFCIAFAAVQLAAATAARGQEADSAASLSRQLLEIWNRSDEGGARSGPAWDQVLRAERRESGFGAIGARPDARTPSPGAAMPGFASPGGRSLTPNLDRLLGRREQPSGGATPLYGAPTGLGTRLPSMPVPSPYGSGSGTPLSYCPSGNGGDDDSPGHDDKGSGHDGNGQGENGNGQGRGHDGNNGHKGKGDHSDPPATPTPEPATMALYGAVCGAFAVRALWRRALGAMRSG